MGGRHTHLEVVLICATLKTCFIKLFFFHSRDPQFQVLLLFQRPHFFIFLFFFLAFLSSVHQVWLNFSSQDTNFGKYLFPRPGLSRKYQRQRGTYQVGNLRKYCPGNKRPSGQYPGNIKNLLNDYFFPIKKSYEVKISKFNTYTKK